MDPVPPETRQPASRPQTLFAYLTVVFIGLSVLAILAMLLLPMFGVHMQQQETTGWKYLVGFPLIALPAGALCIIGLVVSGAINRRRSNTEAGK